MLLSAVSVLVIALQSPEIPEGLMNNPVYADTVNFNTEHCILPIECIHELQSEQRLLSLHGVNQLIFVIQTRFLSTAECILKYYFYFYGRDVIFTER
jgi:hypothetical protein